MTTLFYAKTLILTITLGMALADDIRYCRIKNSVTYPAAAAGILVNMAEAGFPGTLLSLQGWFVPVTVLFVLYYINVMGAGDIKLFAAIGAVMGLPFVTYCFFFSVYIGGGIACWLLVRRRQFRQRIRKICGYGKTVLYTGRLFPYSVRGDNESKFIFTAAIVPGTVVSWVLFYLI